MTSTSLHETPARQALQHHAATIKPQSLATLATASGRLAACELACDGLRLNFGLNHVTPETLRLLVALAEARDVTGWRARMARGEKINTSENRAALHMALRQKDDTPVTVDGVNIVTDIRRTRERLRDITARVRDGRYKGASGKAMRHVVNVGIGGSDLGPRMAVRALSSYADGPQAHFVANADAFELDAVRRRLDPAETLFIIVSKTFSSLETTLNAQAARSWIAEKLGPDAVRAHFLAVTTNAPAARDFGIADDHIFPLWDWVGGRFSLWSAVGLIIEMTIGSDHFQKLLDGAAAMDRHFMTVPLAQNLPAIFGLLGIWSRNFLQRPALAILPYSERLRDLPRYLQQLEMESNGKSVMRDGQPVDVPTAPIVFGECGTVGQHGFHQWLHQGTDIITADFIAVAHEAERPETQEALLSNLAAQASAMAFGRADTTHPENRHPGNRGSNLIVIDRLDPYHLGLLLALYEHKVFVESVVWGINAFDQPGVEYGKQLARSIGQKSSNPADAMAAAVYGYMRKAGPSA
jgi:glucose-6-phosphate isomerase